MPRMFAEVFKTLPYPDDLGHVQREQVDVSGCVIFEKNNSLHVCASLTKLWLQKDSSCGINTHTSAVLKIRIL